MLFLITIGFQILVMLAIGKFRSCRQYLTERVGVGIGLRIGYNENNCGVQAMSQNLSVPVFINSETLSLRPGHNGILSTQTASNSNQCHAISPANGTVRAWSWCQQALFLFCISSDHGFNIFRRRIISWMFIISHITYRTGGYSNKIVDGFISNWNNVPADSEV